MISWQKPGIGWIWMSFSNWSMLMMFVPSIRRILCNSTWSVWFLDICSTIYSWYPSSFPLTSQKISTIFGEVISRLYHGIQSFIIIHIISKFFFLHSTVPEADWSCQEALCLQPTFRERQRPGDPLLEGRSLWKEHLKLSIWNLLEPTGTYWKLLESTGTNWNQLEPIVPLVHFWATEHVGPRRSVPGAPWRLRWWRVVRSAAPTPTPESEVGW